MIEQEVKSYSWDIIDSSTAVKHCDKSFFEHHGTGIPRETVSFWEIGELGDSRRKDIQLEYNGSLFNAYFSIDPLNRTRLFWNSDLQKKLIKYYSVKPAPLARYRKVNDKLFKLDIFVGSDALAARAVEEKDNNYSEADNLSASTLTYEALKEVAIKRESRIVKTRTVISEQKERDPYIAELAKRSANGRCQLCNNTAPFVDKKGKPYLESHHLIWISQGGPDSIDNTVALCPNCHRKMHIVANKEELDLLKKKVLALNELFSNKDK